MINEIIYLSDLWLKTAICEHYLETATNYEVSNSQSSRRLNNSLV